MLGGVRPNGDEPALDAFFPRQPDVAFRRETKILGVFRFVRSDVDVVPGEEAKGLLTLPYAHAATSRIAHSFHHSTTISMGQAATKLGHGGASPLRGS